MKKIILYTVIGVLLTAGVIYYFSTKLVHTDELHHVKVEEKHHTTDKGKEHYTIHADGMTLIVKHKSTWDLIQEGEAYNISYEYADSIEPTILSIVDESEELEGSGH
ncbi:hypothetical protein ACFFGV_12790 [Pontibacillus salicampi]|uniref:DUF3139 domain-containing protein n=1 Tax=Pontibacillus salicampi TaxID=1449801 RepID=A0ABV6LQA0_9BACI